MAKSTGYSSTPLAKKLGIVANVRVRTRNAPQNYLQLLRPLPANVNISTSIRTRVDVWHLFTTRRDELVDVLSIARMQINQAGIIWVSWPKKSSGVKSEITEDTIRDVALPLGLVDIKVCAVDEVWSGLKLVIRKELRAALNA